MTLMKMRFPVKLLLLFRLICPTHFPANSSVL